MACAIHVGTSGWHYQHWKGPFYPPALPASGMLEFYTRHFDTVELNNTFYRLPPQNALRVWRDNTPPAFCFAMKGSRFLTHMKKLKDPEQGIARFFERADILGDKLGPVLFQLPPWWEVNAARLDAFLDALPRHHRYAFELRNPTWHSREIYDLLGGHGAAFCIWELAGERSPTEITTDFAYIRLHGPGGAYQGSYGMAALRQWAGRLETWRRSLRAIHLYFDNDQAAYAVENARTLHAMVHSALLHNGKDEGLYM